MIIYHCIYSMRATQHSQKLPSILKSTSVSADVSFLVHLMNRWPPSTVHALCQSALVATTRLLSRRLESCGPVGVAVMGSWDWEHLRTRPSCAKSPVCSTHSKLYFTATDSHSQHPLHLTKGKLRVILDMFMILAFSEGILRSLQCS